MRPVAVSLDTRCERCGHPYQTHRYGFFDQCIFVPMEGAVCDCPSFRWPPLVYFSEAFDAEKPQSLPVWLL